MNEQVQIDIVLPHPPERVWRAITDPKALAKWLMPNDFRPRRGHRFRFTSQHNSAIECEVVEIEAPHRLAYTWRENPGDAPDLVTWVLELVEAGTRVRLEHTRLTDEPTCMVDACGPARTTSAAIVARLARFLGRRGPSRYPRGKVTVTTGSAFTCVAISPSATKFEETLR